MITIQPPALGLSAAVEPILRSLPRWYGVESAVQMYVQQADDSPTFMALHVECGDMPVGFLTLIRHSAAAAEIFTMGVLPPYHRQGVGRKMIRSAEAYLRKDGVKFLQVKTVSDEYPDESYKRTRAFYQAMGFVLLEEFPDLWGPHYPCWQMVKAL